MADWYVNFGDGSTTGYYAVAQWQASHSYSVGNIIRQLATPTVGNERCFRCSTAGTSGTTEPTWSLTKGATTTSGTAVFTEVTGNSTYNWSAPFARLQTPTSSYSWVATGDRVFVGDNHAETQSTSMGLFGGYSSSVFCVNHLGSIPPTTSDLLSSATISTTGASNITIGTIGSTNTYAYGLQFYAGSGSSTANISVSDGHFLEACSFVLNNSSNSSLISVSEGVYGDVIRFKNTTVSFGATGQTIQTTSGDFVWTDTASAVTGTIPTKLLSPTGASNMWLDSIDLSSVGSGKNLAQIQSNGQQRVRVVNCKLASGVTINSSSSTFSYGSSVELIISDSSLSAFRQERYVYAGSLTTETVNVRTDGATDGIQPISWKIATNASAHTTEAFESFPIAQWNAIIGSSLTATIEVMNDGTTLTSADIWIEIHALSSAGSPLGTLVSSGETDPLASGSSLSSSSATWTTTGISSPITQNISVSFTPEIAGYVRAVVKVAKASTTIYVDPLMTVS